MNLLAKQQCVNKQRSRKDKIAKHIISAFGGAVLLTMVVLIWHLFGQAATLLRLPGLELVAKYSAPDSVRLMQTNDVLSGQPAVGYDADCNLIMLYPKDKVLGAQQSYRQPCTHQLSVVRSANNAFIADVSPKGLVRITPLEDITLSDNASVLPQGMETALSFYVPQTLWEKVQGWQLYMSPKWAIINITTPDQQYVKWVNRKQPTLLFEHHFTRNEQILPLAGTEQMLVADKSSLRFVTLEGETLTSQHLAKPIKWMSTITKQRSVFIAFENGEVSRWSVRNTNGVLTYMPSYTLTIEAGEVPVAVYSHGSSNGAILLTNKHTIRIINRTTGEMLDEYRFTQQPIDLHWSGKHIYALFEHSMTLLNLTNIAGVTTYSSLFEAQQYEGYQEPTTVWQTTSASDYQETKMSLVPLLIGSFKASLLALAIAIPLAVGAAVYTAYFANRRIRHWIKPTIEMLEAIPSVLIGFIAAIWLSPLAESFLISLGFFIVTVPIGLLLFAPVQYRLAVKLPQPMQQGWEVLFCALIIVALGYISSQWVPGWIDALFSIDAANLLTKQASGPLGKTTWVVSIALGIAISPSIYSLAEDAISGVPGHLKQASYALGATRLQTLHRVVLYVAMPGIVAAIMLGFGRAFGETMIVLMVTGNTPVSDWGLFEGLRALTANLAIELPEAEVGNIHFQVLFLTACLLFSFTFVVNTIAELLTKRLRRAASYE